MSHILYEVLAFALYLKNRNQISNENPEIKTYGCRLNFYESEVIRRYAKDNNLQNHIFINSCAVTNKTIADLKNEIRKVKKENQQSQVVLTGCAAQIHKRF